MRRIPVPTVLTAAALVIVLVVYMVTFQVRFSEAVVKVRLGQADESSVIDGRDPRNVGLHFKWPVPIETLRHLDMRLRVLETAETEIKTQDGHNVVVGCYAIWRIADPLLFSKRVAHDARAFELLRARINEARAVVIGKHAMGALIHLDRQLVERTHAQIYQQMRDHAGPGVLHDYGIELVEVGIRRISLPAEATQKVQEAMVQERERRAADIRGEAQSVATAINSRAEAARDAILRFAERKAREIESAGVQAATRILAQIPEEDRWLFNWLRWLEGIEVALKQNTTVFLDWDTDVYRYFKEAPAPPAGPSPASPGRRDGR